MSSFYFVFLWIFIVKTVSSQSSFCHHCFGNTWCNNFTDASFPSEVRVGTCNTKYDYDGKNPVIKNIMRVLSEHAVPMNGALVGCLTATVHEAHEDHTVRICINNASLICPTVQNVVFSNVNDISPDARFSCQGCTTDYCNTDTFIQETTTSSTTTPSTTTPSTTTPSTTAPSTTISSSISTESIAPSPSTSEASTASISSSTEESDPLVTGSSTDSISSSESTDSTSQPPGDSATVDAISLVLLMGSLLISLLK